MDKKKAEEEIFEFWNKNKIYAKVKEKNAKGKKFYMMDGPPYANGKIHIGHALNKTLKDIAMRSQRLQGRDVFDRAGYDTHGVPIEFQVEKLIGSKSKKDIEKYGVENFINKCKEFATQHISSMNKEFENLGVWMDFDNAYLTLSDEYIESIWAAFKEADKKKLLYLGKYPVHVCTRCETAVAFNEVVYAKQKDTSVYVKYPLKNDKNKFLLIWTTTPWTLPANTGVMVHPDVDYQEVEVSNGEIWIIAKDLVPGLMSKMERGFTIKKDFKGKKLEGIEYTHPLAENLKVNPKKSYRVVLSARYVTTQDGTGLVHCAPGHGKEDYEVGIENGLEVLSPVNINGILMEETGKYAGKKAREVDSEIIKDLEEREMLVFKEVYEHDYPLCWRDKTPLIMISQPQWFLKISDIQKKLLKDNEKTNWVPDYMKLRMKAWLEGISDWPVSRQRYWGTPLPIWVSNDGDRIVVESAEELKKLSGLKKVDLHKPGIDKIIIKKNGKEYKRVTEVLDVWFDSGVSSWAALGGKNSPLIKKYWPADLNIEGKDQFRGWWNSQMILSEITFDKKPFESVSVHGMMLDISKRKMSKSEGNIVTPHEIIDKYGRDSLRYFLAKMSRGEDFSFDEEEFKDIGKFFMMLGNLRNFLKQTEKGKKKVQIEDEWILSKYNNLVDEVTKAYNRYEFYLVLQKIEDFVLRDLSKSYVKMIRDRSDEVYDLLNEIYLGIIKMLSPVTPFMTERIWQEMKNEKDEISIHLESFPKTKKKEIDLELEKNFDKVMRVIEIGLFERDKAKSGLKWPLAKATVYSDGLDEKFEEIIARQLNVKKVVFKKGENKVELDLEMNDELEAEGFAREVSRKIQAERKNLGLSKGDLIELKLATSSKIKKYLEKNIAFLKERTNSKKIEFVDSSNINKGIIFTIKEENIDVEIRNLKVSIGNNI